MFAMKIIHRYFLREFLTIMSILTLGLALIFSLLDLIDKIDDFLPGKLTMFRLAEYILLTLPKYLYYLLPMALLICSLFVFSQASRNKEIIAFKAIGGRTKKLFYPFIIAGLLFSLFSFSIGEFIVPAFATQTLEFRKSFMKNADKVTFKEGTIWMRGTDGSPVRIELYVPKNNIAKGVSIFILGEGTLKKRMEAEEARWNRNREAKGVWELKNVIIYDLEKGGVSRTVEMDYTNLESPDFFTKGMKKPEEMGIVDLYRYTAKLKAAGFRDEKLIVDMHSKISYPVANLFMMILGISLSVMSSIGGGLIAAGLGISISFIYWLGYTFMLSMGYTRILPPAVATWMMPVIFSIVAVYLFKNVPE
jgi:lipopolysaccharide export system permease protein